MKADVFASGKGGLDDKGRDVEDVLGLGGIGGEGGFGEGFDFGLEAGEKVLGFLEAGVGSEDGDVVAHGSLDGLTDADGVVFGDAGGLGDVEVFGLKLDFWFAGGGFARSDGEDDGFEEAVAGEAVGAVDAGAGDFSARVEPRNGGAGFEVGDDASAGVMLGGDDRDPFLFEVDTEGAEFVPDCREFFM